jgi:hypothetical protein
MKSVQVHKVQSECQTPLKVGLMAWSTVSRCLKIKILTIWALFNFSHNLSHSQSEVLEVIPIADQRASMRVNLEDPDLVEEEIQMEK